MVAAEFEIKWPYDRRRYLVEGEDVCSLFGRAWDELGFLEIIRTGAAVETPSKRRELFKLQALFEKSQRGELKEEELRGLDVRLSVGGIRCVRVDGD